jgi:hypothetical protein
VSVTSDLAALRSACLAVACAETSCHPPTYRARQEAGTLRSPLDLHCSPVAYAVLAVFGGAIVRGTVEGVRHYWNRLPDGVEVDLTSCQFGGDGRTPLKRGRKAKLGELTPLSFLAFLARVRDQLSRRL